MKHSVRHAKVQQWVLTQWQKRGVLFWCSWPVACVFSALVRLRHWCYQRGYCHSTRMKAVVVVVGNVVAGGVGKTPVVMALVQHLQRQGLAVGVVSRGYGRENQDCQEVLAHSTTREVGDEPALIHQRTRAPVFVARDRVQAARELLQKHPHIQVIVCDDGLQHWPLQRDIEIGVFDDRGVGNGWVQPAGPLREPWPRAFDMVLHTGEHPAFSHGYQVRRALASHARQAGGTQCALSQLRQHPVHALAGIAHPERFFSMLRALGFELAQTTALPDHFDFQRDGQTVLHQTPNDDAHEGIDSWPAHEPRTQAAHRVQVCTEKDAVKLWAYHPEVWAIPLELSLPDEFWGEFDQRIQAALSSRP